MSTHVQRPPSRRVLRTALQVLVAVAALVPVFLQLLAFFDVAVDGPAVVAITGVAVMVATTVVNTVERAGSVPVWRTLVQVVVAVAALVPAVVAALAEGGIHVDTAGLTVITGFAVMVATTVQNLLEQRGTIPELLVSEASQITQTDNRVAYVDGPQPGEEVDVDELDRLDEAAAVADAMFAGDGEGA
jgi:hypothetical protein